MAGVEFGVFDWVDWRRVPLGQLYEERLRLVEAADAARFYCYHLAEHHATPLGMTPSPSVFLAAVAQRTRRIHLGPLVYFCGQRRSGPGLLVTGFDRSCLRVRWKEEGHGEDREVFGAGGV